MIDVREYTDPHGRSLFQQWFEDLDARADAKVTVALARLQQGNVSNVKGVGGGVRTADRLWPGLPRLLRKRW